MPVATVTLEQLLDITKAALIGNTSQPITLVDGDPILALLNASAIGDMVILADIKNIEKLTRASTSTDSDLDSWMADFGFDRIEAFKASGSIQFTLDTGYGSDVILNISDITISSSRSAASFKLVANTEHAYYESTPESRYVIPSGTEVIELPIEAVLAGSDSNVASNTLTILNTPISGVNSVVNLDEINNGKDTESDQEYQARFRSFILGLNTGNRSAILSAIESVLGSDPDVIFIENTDSLKRFRSGFFQIVAENGSGTLTDSEIANIRSSVLEKISLGVTFEITKPTLIRVGVIAGIVYNEKYISGRKTAESAIAEALASAVNSSKIGSKIYYSDLIQSIMQLQRQHPVIRAVDSILIGSYLDGDYIQGSTSVTRTQFVTINTALVI